MKILFITSSFFPKIGGVEKHVCEISLDLIRRGHQVQVITEETLDRNINKNPNYQILTSSDNEAGKFDRADKSIYFTHKQWQGIDIYYFRFGKPNWFKKFRIWLMLLANHGIIKDVDLVHCHDVFFWYLPFRFFYPKKPVYTTFHGYETKFPPSRKAILLRKISEKLSWGNICVGEFIKKWYGTKTDGVIYGAPTVKRHKNYRINRYGLKTSFNSKKKSKTLRILFVGRLEVDTGIPIYLETLKLLKNEGIIFKFEACGDGTLRKQVEEWGKVYGMVRDVQRYLSWTDVVFASSYLSIIEAISAKKPVFSAYNNDLKEDYLKMASFSRFITIESNSLRLAEKIRETLEHPVAREKMVKEAFHWVKTQSWELITDKYLKLWNRLTNLKV